MTGTGPVDAALRLLSDPTLLVPFALGSVLGVIAGRWLARRTGAPAHWVILALLSLVIVALATLQAGRAGGGIFDRDPLAQLSLGRLVACFEPPSGPVELLPTNNEAVLNLLLYVPFGVFAALASPRPVRVLAVTTLIILSMEACQALFNTGVCSTLDIGRNIMGAAVAIGVVALGRRWRGRARGDHAVV